MKYFLLLFICIAIVSYYGAQGETKAEEREVEDSDDEDSRRDLPGLYPYRVPPSLSAVQAAAMAGANVNNPVYHPTVRPLPTPTLRPYEGCYSCVDCPDPSKLSPTSVCTTYGAARCVVYVEKYAHLRNPLYVRGCVSERGTCEEIRRSHDLQPHVKLLSCNECVGDRCNTNGVGRSLPDLTGALFFLVLTPLFTKYALS